MPAKSGYNDKEDPSFWFLLLDRARSDGRFADADRCLRELRRLGVTVTWKKPRRTAATTEAARE